VRSLRRALGIKSPTGERQPWCVARNCRSRTPESLKDPVKAPHVKDVAPVVIIQQATGHPRHPPRNTVEILIGTHAGVPA